MHKKKIYIYIMPSEKNNIMPSEKNKNKNNDIINYDEYKTKQNELNRKIQELLSESIKHFSLLIPSFKKKMKATSNKENNDIFSKMKDSQIMKLYYNNIDPSQIPSQFDDSGKRIVPMQINSYKGLGPFIYLGKCIENKLYQNILTYFTVNIKDSEKNVFLINDGRLVIDKIFSSIVGLHYPLQEVRFKKEKNKLVYLNKNNNNNINTKNKKKEFVFIFDSFSHVNEINRHTINKKIFKKRNDQDILMKMTNWQIEKLESLNIDLNDIPNQNMIQTKINLPISNIGPYIYMGKLNNNNEDYVFLSPTGTFYNIGKSNTKNKIVELYLKNNEYMQNSQGFKFKLTNNNLV